ncbi:MAG: GNAT family N-acetyltransferase [Methanothrix sp.]|jgi:ribosomal-protein-alanine N-acetyltransferase|uniref:[SSU ribosomal protein S18P]-alanine acetyltransferase n=1 Tax=Methanothrix thermoacetophila (strain DSM 6194 / JCM 14653 / NBRC 101360 / PT) TaxID=349307 RepID=A0B661_METTP|nr:MULTISPECIES: GNAT family N-acetyltransferase [Methanothrix]ABK14185.1 [SSU ribosomal protein S18P]-alanine acetyltransferase [Methanothrix thermoacetophila PT]MBC7079716.1 GNAT family N-acetyltransferase [Methanothrix sp.]NPU87791.1 GNAT family N-acetyltransferase [Methanothrix sp.]
MERSSCGGDRRFRPVIRQFEIKDLPELMEIDREVGGGYSPELFMTFHEYHPQTMLVAEIDGKVVGVAIGFKPTPFEGRVFWLAVRQAYQGHGIGRSLLSAILRIFSRLGALSATLEVRIGNRRAQKLYASMGFVVDNVIPTYYSDGEAALIMRKVL